jgi:hypothetical protein
MVTKRKVEDFVDEAERSPELPKVKDPVESYIEGLPAWKQRNLEPKRRGTQFRCSESQIALLQVAALDQEMSIQKVLERIVWPALEERYGTGETTDVVSPT